ncbi:MAG: helix-turn-helix transcriptional regulator [Acidisphaera sp.]|nr:helix-turn-helix transcriptional regulator [Acidisphaera sp.]
MTTLQAALRGGAIALLVLLALAGLRTARTLPADRYGVVFDVCALGFLLESAPGIEAALGWGIVPLRLLSNATPAIFQLWAAASLADRFEPSQRRWLPFALLIALTGAAVASGNPWLWQAVHGVGLALVAVGIGQALLGRSADLLEWRRRVRLLFACGVGAVIAVNTLFASFGRPAPPAVAAVTVLALAAALLRLRVERQVTPPPIAQSATVPAAPASADRALADRIVVMMEHDRPYRDPALTVAALADRLKVPEYRVRRAINGALGQRNFVAFVNGYRLAEARAALADPAQARVAVLTIALDAGFGSVGPFNRAFREATGETPTDYRKRLLTSPMPQSAMLSTDRPTSVR